MVKATSETEIVVPNPRVDLGGTRFLTRSDRAMWTEYLPGHAEPPG